AASWFDTRGVAAHLTLRDYYGTSRLGLRGRPSPGGGARGVSKGEASEMQSAPRLTRKSRRLLKSSSPVALQKIDRFSLRPNHFYKSGRLVPQRGVSRSSRTLSVM